MMSVEKDEGILTLTIDRPDAKNALNLEVISTLISSLKSAADDDGVRVAILTGAPPLFTSGMDVSVFEDHGNEKNDYLLRYKVPEMFHTIIDFPKPLIVAVNGVGVGFGATIIGLADLAIMGESARVTIPFSTLGVGPEACSSYTLPRLMGWQKASWMLYAGEWMDAQACLHAGLVLEVVPDDQVKEVALQKARHLALRSLTSLIATKEVLMAPHRDALHEANRFEMQRFMELLDGPACKEGVGAFFEKRAPEFVSKGL